MKLPSIGRYLGFIFLASAVTFSSITTANSAIKIGTVCSASGKLANVGSVKLICTKVGKKLIWSKVLTKGEATTTKTPGSSEISGPTETTATSAKVILPAIPSDKYQDVMAMAQSSVITDMPAVSTSNIVTYTFEDSIFPIERNVIKNGVNSALAHYSPFLNSSQQIHIFVFGTSQFLKSEAPKADPTNKEFADDMARQSITWGKRSASNCVGMGGFAVPEVPFPFIAIDAPCTTNDPAAYGVLPHELTHTLQFAFGKANSRCWAPIWLVEGQAQVGATALAFDESGPASGVHRASWVNRIVKPNSVGDILAMEGETKDFSEYTLGAALSEYLVAKGGWLRSLNLYSQAAKQSSSGCLNDALKIANFDKAFQSLYGETLADFYVEALPYLQWLADHK